MKAIYHITSAREAEDARESGEYAPQTFGTEGFIHCSYVGQLTNVANIRFKGRTDLVLLEVDPTKLPCTVVDENLEGGAELFPHVYGRLPMSALVRIHQFPCDGSGCFKVPSSVAAV